MKYLIWSHRKRMWWCTDRSGYSRGVHGAGQYSIDTAANISVAGLPGANIVIESNLAYRAFDGADADTVEAELARWRTL